MAFYRCSMGGNSDLPKFGATPDVIYAKNAASTSDSNVNITVTQKPRYIVLAQWGRVGSTYGGLSGIVDVKKGIGFRMGYNTNGAYNGNWSNYTNYFPTISASTVVFSPSAYGANSRVQIQIFY